MSEEKHPYRGLIEAAVMESNANRPTYIKPMMDELKTVYDLAEEREKYKWKADGFNEINKYLNEAYKLYHEVEDDKLRAKLISGHISSQTTQLFQRLGDQHGYLSSDQEPPLPGGK